MAELELEKNERLALRAEAHPLQPVVLLGTAGLTEAVVTEIDRALAAHALIKVRIPVDDRGERDAVSATIADRLGAARIQSIGKLVVLYRPPPEETQDEDQPPKRGKAPARTAKPGRTQRR
jgi:RNA-binding protein